MAIKELKPFVTPLKALLKRGYSPASAYDVRLNQVRAAIDDGNCPNYSLRICVHAGVTLDHTDGLEDRLKENPKALSEFKAQVIASFEDAIKKSDLVNPKLSSFKVDWDFPAITSNLSFEESLTPEQLLEIHDGALLFEFWSNVDLEQVLGLSIDGAYFSDEPSFRLSSH